MAKNEILTTRVGEIIDLILCDTIASGRANQKIKKHLTQQQIYDLL